MIYHAFETNLKQSETCILLVRFGINSVCSSQVPRETVWRKLPRSTSACRRWEMSSLLWWTAKASTSLTGTPNSPGYYRWESCIPHKVLGVFFTQKMLISLSDNTSSSLLMKSHFWFHKSLQAELADIRRMTAAEFLVCAVLSMYLLSWSKPIWERTESIDAWRHRRRSTRRDRCHHRPVDALRGHGRPPAASNGRSRQLQVPLLVDASQSCNSGLRQKN